MKALFLVLVLLTALIAGPGAAADVEKMYYVGDVKLSSPSGQPRGSEVILLEKTHDPGNSTITEHAIEVKTDRSVGEYTMTMKVKGTSFTIKDDRNTIQGTGDLFGPAWRWTYFQAVYESITTGVRIEDENYMTDPSVLVARKKISVGGKALMYMDITLKAVTPQTFAILSACLLKK
ncbi:MAG: hypothetical protein JO250_17685 [Armatimonadetes bacterium]|nr:hypothetical protein [Armatimonadota bacterium]